jgi:hypothetical protein
VHGESDKGRLVRQLDCPFSASAIGGGSLVVMHLPQTEVYWPFYGYCPSLWFIYSIGSIALKAVVLLLSFLVSDASHEAQVYASYFDSEALM